MLLESYIEDRWTVGGGGAGELLRDATTGEQVAEVRSPAVDFAAALEYARAVGGAALRALTFHERAALLKNLAKALGASKEELYALSYRTGATRRDAWLDIDGGLGTLFVYAGKAVRELPNGQVYIDGAPEPLAKSGKFLGQHICVPLEGAAVQINAFNFPVWGMLEKLAPALLAGMPTIIKPATSTAYLAELLFRRIIDSRLLPAGAVQLLCGSVGNLFDHLQGEDVVSFTGSAATAALLRRHAAVAERSVRFTAETDSLNSSILGADAQPGSAEFDLFVNEVVREMSVKAGQKCTAIRKAIVPQALCAAVLEAVRGRLTELVVGDPRLPAVNMGPLVSLAQRREVRAQLARLTAEGSTVFGGELALQPAGADAERGAFLAPTLLHCRDARAARAVHTVEAFGPVCTVLPYASVEDAITLARRGGGSLVASVFSADDATAARLVAGLAPFHGRILVVNAECAPDSTGHGSPLPHLVHGGPGRAGGGEELGGMRAVLRYMQRTAVQGTPDVLTAVSARWVRGARERTPQLHPFRIPFGALAIGDSFNSQEREVTLADIERFAALSGDNFYAHMDEAAARRNPLFGGRVAHGYFLIAAAAGLFVEPAFGPVLANYGIDALRFVKPVRPGDRIRVRIVCKEKSLRQRAGYGEVRWDTEIINQDGAVVASYDVLTMVSERAIPDQVA
jgi:oxepin-CoA hydrolase / 3-oxo-5,6-dehydrosuberyl-CoA semialdehyde dehydrogenase